MCSIEVIAISGWPRSLTIRDISTMDPLTPELEAITKTSLAWGAARSYRRWAMVGSRSKMPRPSLGGCAAMHDDIAQRDPIARDQAAGASGEFHRQALGVSGAEGLEDTVGEHSTAIDSAACCTGPSACSATRAMIGVRTSRYPGR